MCGIAGFIGPPLPSEILTARAERMGDAIAHRGPDGSGTWVDEARGVGLSHRRLAIIDPSPLGAQPMTSRCGRFTIIFNGEIYNFKDLLSALRARGIEPVGHSDTEVLLEHIAQIGLDRTLQVIAGMFAIALWDRRDQSLVLVRDPFGIKPVYWAIAPDGTFLFGSELKALRAHPSWDFAVDPDSLESMLSFGHVLGPQSIYRGVNKLSPGHTLTYRHGTAPQLRCFWDARSVAREGISNQIALTEAEAVDALDALLRKVVDEHMIADVPLGAFLSGGIDSSTVVALMAATSGRTVRTFTIAMEDQGYDESADAAAVAAHLGTDHTELRLSAAQARAVIPDLPTLYDEPFADSSQIPTLLVAQLARHHVTVALSGDGGDEMFAGYNRHVKVDRLNTVQRLLPAPVRRGLADGLTAVPVRAWDRMLRGLPGMPRLPGDKIHKLAAALATRDSTALYRSFLQRWPSAYRGTIGGRKPSLPEPEPGLDPVAQVQLLDALTYLPDDILVKLDRATMAVSLEARVPLLDRRIAEFAWRLPKPLRIGGGRGKLALRSVLGRYVPSALTERPKMGFGIPIGEWLRGPLRDWAESLLTETALADHGLLDGRSVSAMWAAHLDGRGNVDQAVWSVLMFQAWWQRWETRASDL